MPWLLLALIPAAWLAGVFQTTIAPALAIRQISPDAFALVAGVWLACGPVRKSTAWSAAGLGLIADLLSAGPLGTAAGAYLVGGLVVLAIREQLSLDGLPIRLALSAGFALGTCTVVAVVYAIAGETTLPISALASRTLGVAIYTTALSVPVHMVVSWLPPLEPARA